MTANRRDPSPGPAPTDLELMLYADGELEGDRIAAVEACLERDAVARSKLLALDRVSSLVRDRATSGARAADGVAAAVMARIAAEAPAPLVDPRLVRPGAAGAGSRRSASNDNARALYFVAAFVVAAAAVVVLWLSPIRGGRGRMARGVVEDEMAAGRSSEADPQKPEADVEHGVEVSAIDFGGANGAVFYVPNGASASGASGTTTVVWLSDDEDDAAGDEP